MNKRGTVAERIFGNMWGLLQAAALILFLVIVIKFLFPSQAYAESKSTLERLSEVINILEDGVSRSVALDLEKGVWLFGFNKDKEYIKYQKTDVFQRCFQCEITLLKPWDCPSGKEGRACLCLCTDKCERVVECRVFEDIEFFVVTDIPEDLNGGLIYEYDGKQGKYLAMPGKGVNQVEISRDDDIIYIGSFVSEKEQVREEFEKFVKFAENIGIAYTYSTICKIVFDFDTDKLTSSHYVVVDADGNANLLSGRGDKKENSATQKIRTAPVLFDDLNLNAANDAFNRYDELQTKDFVIDPHTHELPEGIEEGIFDDKIVLLQRAGKWLWTKHSNYSNQFNNCQREYRSI